MEETKEKRLECEKCQKISEMWEKPDDLLTTASGLGFRIWFSFICVSVLGLVIREPTKDSIISILIFLVPMMREYYGFKPKQKSRSILRIIQLAVIWLVVGICALQIAGVLEIQDATLGFSERLPFIHGICFPFSLIWIPLWALVALTIADYVAYRPDKIQNKKIKRGLMTTNREG